MADTPWTPAPWRYDGDGEARKIRGKDGASIALLMHLSLRARKSDAEVVANARLIAAAPEMAEALERCLNFIANTEGEIGETLESGDMARAALAKARGEDQ